MKKASCFYPIYFINFLLLGATFLYVNNAYAKENFGDAFSFSLEDLLNIEISTGTRKLGETANSTFYPVDIITKADLNASASGDLQDLLQTLSPSFNVSRSPVDDGGTFVRTPTLRSLPGGKMLVLLNGKRVHRSALISLTGDQDIKNAAHSVDLSQFPISAIERIEILRDGAAAQYGSDAIAGVINVILKNDMGVSLQTQQGEYFEGDGSENQLRLNVGVPITYSGLANFTLEYLDGESTSRGLQSPSAQNIIDAGGSAAAFVPVPAIEWGIPNRESYRLAYNLNYDLPEGLLDGLGADAEAYLFGSFRRSKQDGSFFYRDPATNGSFAVSSLQLGPDAIYPTYSLSDTYPGGFTPRFHGDLKDFSVVAGVKGETANQINWDLSASSGTSIIEYRLKNTINPSMGPLSPKSFRPGDLIQAEQQANADFVYQWKTKTLDSPVNVAFGSEYRQEKYRAKQGDEASWKVGELSDLPVGSNGFQGYSPEQVGIYDRSNVAAYLDMEAELTEKLMTGAAIRYEDFSDFGDTLDGKIASRYQWTDMLSLRAAYSSGFAAPTVGQSNMTSTNTAVIDDVLVAEGILPPESEISQFFGSKPLTPEESKNISAGIVLLPQNNFLMTLDYFRIELTDRIGLTSNHEVTPAAQTILEAQGVAGASTIRNVRFFANGYSTITEGFDLNLNYQGMFKGGSLGSSLAFNRSSTRVNSFDTQLLSQRAIINIENMAPKPKATATLHFNKSQYMWRTRLRYFGPWAFTNSDSDPEADKVSLGSETLVDVSATYQVIRMFSVTAGAENIFDNFPDRAFEPGDCCGRVYAGSSPYGFDGGFYYLRLLMNF